MGRGTDELLGHTASVNVGDTGAPSDSRWAQMCLSLEGTSGNKRPPGFWVLQMPWQRGRMGSAPTGEKVWGKNRARFEHGVGSMPESPAHLMGGWQEDSSH